LRLLFPHACHRPAKAKEWTEGLRFYSYSKRANPQANKILTPNGKTCSQMQPRGMAYWVRLAEILNQEPIQPRDRVMMGMLKPLGIERGKPFEPIARQKKLLEEAALVGEAMAKSITFAKRFDGALYRPDTQWTYGFLGNPERKSEFYTQIDKRTALFYAGTGASKGMMIKMPGVGQAYVMATMDKNGNWLDGANTYKLHVPAVVPAKLFWSATVYDNETRCFIENKEDIADRSSMMDLRKNPDGSVDIYFSPKAAQGYEKNWIPTVPGKGWFTVFRLYGPTEAYFDRSWLLPDIELVK
jgi:hypothetical protein